MIIIAATITTPLIVSKFHESKAWRKLAAEHKTFRCACKSKDDIQSAHYLPQKRFPMMRLWRWNLYISCGPCNYKLGNRINWSIRAVLLLVVYGMIKGIYWTGIILYFSLTTAVMVMDISSGGMETSFTGQILIESWEFISAYAGQFWSVAGS